jgi:hypothetical protein
MGGRRVMRHPDLPAAENRPPTTPSRVVWGPRFPLATTHTRVSVRSTAADGAALQCRCMYDSNLNGVKVTVARPDEVFRVHAALSNVLARPGLRPPVADVILVTFADMHAIEGAEAVRGIIEQEFGSPEWIRVDVGYGDVNRLYGEG